MGNNTMAQREHHEGGHRMNDMTPEQMATLKTKKMTLALDLTEAQQTKIKALQLEDAKMRKTKMEEHRAQKEAGEAKKPTSEERYAMTNAHLDHQIAQKAEMKKILSDEQYSKWEKMQHRRGRHGMERRGKGHRGMDREKSKQK